MAFANAAAPEPQLSPNSLALPQLSSNNPFRNRLSMQSSTSPRSMDSAVQQFPFPPTSKNPFLDPSETAANTSPVNNNTAEVENIFRDMTVNGNSDKPAFSNGPLPTKDLPSRSGPPPPQKRPTRPDEQRERPPPPRAALSRDPDSPQKRPTEHRRRASESSTMEHDKRERMERRERPDRQPRTESEERRRRERRREREERHRREKEGAGGPSRSRRGLRNLDIIDKLDVTGVYGQGLFHHDGPFDACNPARNAKKDQRAPMQAFPAGSANMALGGAGPNRSRLDLDKFHGRTEDAFNDYSATRKAPATYREPTEQQRVAQAQYFNPTDRAEQVHGPESSGLGTSTFLEGAPASRSALQRRESDEQQPGGENGFGGGGLQRKKSLAQRLRGMSNSRPRTGYGAEAARSPESRYYNGRPVELSDGGAAKIPAGGASRANGGPSYYNKENEINAFDNEYDRAFDKKGTEIRFTEQEKPAHHSRAASSPGSNGLTRSLTAEAVLNSQNSGEGEKSSGGGGLLSRMKSLKGGSRKTRPERKDSNP